MVVESDDYRDIRSLAVHAEDVVTAFETNRTPGPRAVLRVTPPFAGRMRARLHVESGEEYTGEGYSEPPRPLHVDPDTLLDEERVPAYPQATETEERLRADPEREYSIDRHHTRHTERVAAWREAAGNAVVATVDLDGSRGPHRVRVLALG